MWMSSIVTICLELSARDEYLYRMTTASIYVTLMPVVIIVVVGDAWRCYYVCKGVRCPPIFSLYNLINAGWLVRKCVDIYTYIHPLIAGTNRKAFCCMLALRWRTVTASDHQLLILLKSNIIDAWTLHTYEFE